MKIADIIAEIETYAPLNLQESYDNSGYMCGSHETSVKGVLLAIEITERVVDEAIEKGCNLIISHHPIIFKGIKSLSTDNYVNRPLIKAIKNDITIPISAGIFLHAFSVNVKIKIQDPIQVSTPNTTLFRGITIKVAIVTSNPPPKTIRPLLRCLFPKEKQNPDNKINVQQILCCQIYAP